MRPLTGIVFTDTFTLGEGEGQFAETFPVNSARVNRQRSQDITVIVGNPPYSAGQRSAADDNPNVSYPHLEQRVRNTFAVESRVTNKVSLYDSYKMALRWASDRIRGEGVIAFVTNGSFIDGNADAGSTRLPGRRVFPSVCVQSSGETSELKANARGRREDKIFGSGSRTPVAIMLLVRDPAHRGECQIHYKDIGDYLSREKKLQIVREVGSIAGISDWQRITPDEHNDWLEKRDQAYQAYLPLGSKEGKSKKSAAQSVATRLYSRGISSGGDAWLYSSHRYKLTQRVQAMIAFYEDRRQRVATGELDVAEATRNDTPDRFKWDRERINRLKRNRELVFDPSKLRVGMYRPFVKQNLYFDRDLIQMIYQVPYMFPTPLAPNQAIGVTGRGASGGFYALLTEVISDIQLLFNGQWFARWRYEAHDPNSPDAWVQIRR